MDRAPAVGDRARVKRRSPTAPPAHRAAPVRAALVASALAALPPACTGRPAARDGRTATDTAAARVATTEHGAASGTAPAAPRPPLRVSGRAVVLHDTTSPYSHIQIVQTGTIRTLAFVQDGGTRWPQTVMDLSAPQRPAMKYLRAFVLPLAYVPRASRALVVGLGGGALVALLRRHWPGLHVTAVEIDPEVVHLAREYFGVAPDEHTDVVAADGEAFIRRDTGTYDVIFMDVFLEPSAPGTDSSGVPRHLATVAFLQTLRARLAPGGVVAFNLHHKSSFAPHLRAIEAAFPRVRVVPVAGTGNRIVLAAESFPDEDTVRQAAARIDARTGAVFHLRDQLAGP